MRNGFSLIELLVVIAIIGILASVGVVGYTGYINETKKESALRNMDTIDRAFEQDYIALANDIGGPSEIASQDGEVVTKNDQCIQYVTKVVKNLNAIGNLKNAYDNTAIYAVNMHDDTITTSGGSIYIELQPGQIGFQCANANAAVTDVTNFNIHRCTCTGTKNCTFHSFQNTDVVGGDNCDKTTGTQTQKDACRYHLDTLTNAANRWRTDGTVRLGGHIPDWVCPRADFVDVDSP